LREVQLNVISKEITLDTRGEGDMINITNKLEEILSQTDLNSGIIVIFIPGSTAAITTIEYEPGLRKDFPEALERIVPKKIPYEHDKTWHDGNGHSHVRASLLGPSLSVPFIDNKLVLGTWQQIVFLELDIHSRSRQLIIQILGD
jgi:secondary thiamine-phosphate synthase enzyme